MAIKARDNPKSDRNKAKSRSYGGDTGMRSTKSRGGTHGYSSGKVSHSGKFNFRDANVPTEGNRRGRASGGRDASLSRGDRN